MKTYQIILYNKAKNKTTKVEDFPANSMTALRKRLLELQEGYCEDEVPVVTEENVSSGGFLIKALIAKSDCNYWHIAPIESV